jgi:hypothetical protein
MSVMGFLSRKKAATHDRQRLFGLYGDFVYAAVVAPLIMSLALFAASCNVFVDRWL